MQIKKYSLTLYIIFSFNFLNLIYAQSNRIETDLKNTGNNLPMEYINLNTDRKVFVAGEQLFFKLYLNNSMTERKEQISNFAYIMLRNEKSVILKSSIKIIDGIGYSSIYLPDTLPTGLYQILSFTNYMRNFSEDNYSKMSILIINRFDKVLSGGYSGNDIPNQNANQYQIYSEENCEQSNLEIELNKDSFEVREKIVLRIKLNNQIDVEKASLSVSIREISPVILIDQKSNPSKQSNHDQSSIHKEKIFQKFHYPEKEGIFLHGNIRSTVNPIKNECVVISTPDSIANLQYAFTDSLGNFTFLITDYYFGKNIVVKLKNNPKGNENINIILEDKFHLESKFIPDMTQFTLTEKKFLFNSQDIVHIQKSYNQKIIEVENALDNRNSTFPFVYRYPSSILHPVDYVPMDDFKDITSNILSGIKIIRVKKENEVYVFNFHTKTFFNVQPSIFLDGVPIDNINQVIGLNSEKIEKIELCNILKYQGEISHPGILSIYTKMKIIDFIQFKWPYQKLYIEPFLSPHVFNSPRYSDTNLNSPIPDFRQLLYWNPNVELKKGEYSEIEIYASDYLAEYEIKLVGYTKDGKLLSGTAKIKVFKN